MLLDTATARCLTLWTLTGVLAGFGTHLTAAEQKAAGERPPQAVECTKITGTIMTAPSWKPEPDESSNQVLRLQYLGQKGKVTWLRNGKPYYETEGITIDMRTGFVILVPAEEYVETYVYNPGNAEVLFAMTRSGSQILPNTIKASRGTCTLGFGGKSPGE